MLVSAAMAMALHLLAWPDAMQQPPSAPAADPPPPRVVLRHQHNRFLVDAQIIGGEPERPAAAARLRHSRFRVTRRVAAIAEAHNILGARFTRSARSETLRFPGCSSTIHASSARAGLELTF